ncbi:MAG: hypothetical protein OXH99_17150 [Bryobacterales bacterium]|nr:hypothetical protein [Gammaproteobacteria bacterium]MDE0628124.1 hypothetical protein [Bryobacterales bacterium]
MNLRSKEAPSVDAAKASISTASAYRINPTRGYRYRNGALGRVDDSLVSAPAIW